MNQEELTYSTELGAPSASIKTTLVSIVPFPIREFKPGLIPGQFDLEASINGEPQIKVIGESIYYVWIDPERGNLRITDPSYKVAKSVCDDYNVAQLAAGIECHPGLFWELGEWTVEQIKTRFAKKLDYFRHIQYNWFVELVKMGDDDWEKTRQHYSISDTQRYAAKAIDPTNSRGRQWITVAPDLATAEKVETQICGACGSDVPLSVAVCRYCKNVLDVEKYKKMTFASDVAGISADRLKELSKVN